MSPVATRPGDPRKGLRPKVSLVKADDVPRDVPNRAEKRRLLKALRRLPAPRTGRPWPLQRATGMPPWLQDAKRQRLVDEFRKFQEANRQQEAA